MVTINIQKKDLYLIFAILIFLAGAIIIIATGSNNPAVHGHDLGEIQLPPCTNGQTIVKTSSGWGCRTIEDLTAFHEIDNSPGVAYPFSSERYHLTITGPNFKDKPKIVNQAFIENYCGDFDGCEIRLAMKNYLGALGRESASILFVFYYDAPTNTWRASWPTTNLAGKDNDNTRNDIVAPWNACFFSDADTTNWEDRSKGFGLYIWSGSGLYKDGMSCEMTISD